MSDLTERLRSGTGADRDWHLAEVEARVAQLEKWAHEPFDFTHLIQRLEKLEATVALLAAKEEK